MRDNAETNPDILQLRYRAGDNQATINIELGLIGTENIQSGGVSSGTSAGGSAGGTQTTGIISGGGTGLPPCFIGSTMVTLPGGSQIDFATAYATQIKTALSFDDDGNKVVGEVLQVHRTLVYSYANVTFSDGVSGVIPEHRYFTDCGYVSIKDLIGETVSDDDGNAIEVLSLKTVHVPEGIYVYNLSIKTYENYVADKKRVHNRKPDPVDPGPEF